MTQKKSPSAHHRTTLSGYIFATKARTKNGKKLVKQQYVLHTSSQYGDLRPTNCRDRLADLGHPGKFQRVSRLAFVTAATSLNGTQPKFARCLAVSWAGILYTVYTFSGALAPWNFTRYKIHFTPKSCIFIGSVTARHSSSGHQPNFAAWYKEWNY